MALREKATDQWEIQHARDAGANLERRYEKNTPDTTNEVKSHLRSLKRDRNLSHHRRSLSINPYRPALYGARDSHPIMHSIKIDWKIRGPGDRT